MLLDQLKDYLKITWDEENVSLERIILRGQQYLEEISGTDLDFMSDLSANQLLMDYCRYVYNHSLEYFETNFQRELLRLSIREAVKQNEESASDV